MVWQTAGLGLGLSALLALGLGAWWGASAGGAAGMFGLLATALQSAAVAVMRPVVGGDASRMFRRFGMGMGLRFLGVIAIPVAVLGFRDRFPPLPTALGFLGVIIPLLFFEARLFR